MENMESVEKEVQYMFKPELAPANGEAQTPIRQQVWRKRYFRSELEKFIGCLYLY